MRKPQRLKKSGRPGSGDLSRWAAAWAERDGCQGSNASCSFQVMQKAATMDSWLPVTALRSPIDTMGRCGWDLTVHTFPPVYSRHLPTWCEHLQKVLLYNIPSKLGVSLSSLGPTNLVEFANAMKTLHN